MFKRKSAFRLSVFVILALALVELDDRSSSLSPVRSTLYTLVGPLIQVAEFPTKAVHWAGYLLEDKSLLNKRNREIVQENADLRLRIIELEEAAQRSDWLSEMLNASERLGLEVLLAEMLSIELNPFTRKIVIDKGEDEGIFIGQPVVDHWGVIGQVTEKTISTSAVTLLTDPNHSIPVRVRRNGMLAVANGFGESNLLSVPNIAQHQDIREGDVLITSGLGRRFPPDYPVATVKSVVRDWNAPFLEITAEPMATLDRGYDVLLVWYQGQTGSDSTFEYSMNDSGVR